MTIAEALKKYSDIEAELLLGHVLKQPKEFLYMNMSKKLSAKEALSFKKLAEKRKNGMPVAYLVGYKYFYGLKFKVNRRVLIPRPETEWLVDEALKLLVAKLKINSKKEVRILDVGTGSGAIAVSIANEVTINNLSSKVKVFATDISEQALKVAKANSKAHKVLINFSKRNLLTGIKGKFDIILANLPYVPATDYEKFFSNLKHEPKIALTDGTDKFVLLTAFIKQLPKILNKHAAVILETDPTSIKILKRQIKISLPNKNTKVVKDIQGLERFIVIA